MTAFVESQRMRKQRDAELRLKNNRLGMNIFQASWIMAFVAMVVVNWQLRFNYAQWPPDGVAPFDALPPSVATVALLLSAFLTRQSLRCLRDGNLPVFLRGWRLAAGLGAAFLAIIAYEFLSVGEAALATQYGITFRLMTGFHLAHALVILAVMLRVYHLAKQGRCSGGAEDSWPAEGAAKLWYFVTVAWLLFYVVLYWIR